MNYKNLYKEYKNRYYNLVNELINTQLVQSGGKSPVCTFYKSKVECNIDNIKLNYVGKEKPKDNDKFVYFRCKDGVCEKVKSPNRVDHYFTIPKDHIKNHLVSHITPYEKRDPSKIKATGNLIQDEKTRITKEWGAWEEIFQSSPEYSWPSSDAIYKEDKYKLFEWNLFEENLDKIGDIYRKELLTGWYKDITPTRETSTTKIVDDLNYIWKKDPVYVQKVEVPSGSNILLQRIFYFLDTFLIS